MKVLRRFDMTIIAPPLMLLFRCIIFNRKYPGSKLVKINDENALNQFCVGILTHSVTDPPYGFMKNTRSDKITVKISDNFAILNELTAIR